MSDHGPTENPAVQELDVLVRHLADELAGFRRRALTAEARLKEVEGHDGGAVGLDLAARCASLEQENEQLQTKLNTATERAKKMLERVRFLRQQAQAGSVER
jgi:hypothetical protein